MAYLTRDEILTELSAVNTAIQNAIEMSSYSTDSGQGKISVSRQKLEALRSHREHLISQLRELDSDSGIVSIEVHR